MGTGRRGIPRCAPLEPQIALFLKSIGEGVNRSGGDRTLNPEARKIEGPIPELIEEGYRESWNLYRRSLESPSSREPHWDWVVLTAADERQARAFRIQLDRRREADLLPWATKFLVVPDPEGRRIGSGGATVNVLGEIAAREKHSRPASAGDLEALFAGRRILILHSGGESRRLPHCSAFGKIFARVPHELPDGRVSTLFDEFLISLAGLPYRMYEGVVVASGDVLLLFDHRRLDFARQGVVGVAVKAPAELGPRHGVYLSDPERGAVRRFLHKVPIENLKREGAVDSSGAVAIDSGVVWFDPGAVATVLRLFGYDEVASEFRHDGLFRELLAESVNCNLYGDLLAPLASETDREEYLADAGEVDRPERIARLRLRVWEKLRGTPFWAIRLPNAEFIHFGTTDEYIGAMAEGAASKAGLGWRSPVASFGADERTAEGVVVLGSLLRSVVPQGAGRSVVEDSYVGGELMLGDGCLLSRVWSEEGRVEIASGAVVYQLPAALDEEGKERGFVTHVYGVGDNPKKHFGDPGATFLNRRFSEWLDAAGVDPDLIWEGIAEPDRSLWNARLFPWAPARDGSLALALWMQKPEAADEELRRRWLHSPRMSFAESALRADFFGAMEDLTRLGDLVRVEKFLAEVEGEKPSGKAGATLGDRPSDVLRRSEIARERLEHLGEPMLRMRGWKYLADALLAQKFDKRCLERGSLFEDRAFDTLAAAIRDATPWPSEAKPGPSVEVRSALRVVVEAPVRIDFAGGWSDTPPFSIENGGKVLNAAIRLRGRPPIRVEGELIEQPVLLLESRDLNVSRKFESAEPILRYGDPSDPLAIHKAALVFSGIVFPREEGAPQDLADLLKHTLGGGLRLSTDVAVPHGSGLGTSSILASALLVCLRRMLGRPVDFDTVFDDVLCLEQMLTTGGGWQDQVGGMVGGIKLVITEPGLPQRPRVKPVRLAGDVSDELARRLVLVYTGQRRLAKGILRAIMGRYVSREPEIVGILRRIRVIAERGRAALERGDLDEFGRLIAEHWEENKKLDPGMSTPFIERLFDACRPYSAGAKLAGAGGGGFMILIAKDREAAEQLPDVLERAFPGTEVSPWPCEISPEGLTVAEE